MYGTQRRQRGVSWLVRWLLPLGLCACASALLAQGQYEAARDAMAPPSVSGPIIMNRITPTGFGPIASTTIKAQLRAAAKPSPSAGTTTPAPATPTGEPPAPGTPPTPNPTQPAPAPDRDKPLPLENPDQVRMSADNVQYRDKETIGEGHVEVRYQDITVQSYRARLDEQREWGTFAGEVNLTAKLYTAHADEMRINLETEEFSGRQVAAKIEPDYFKGQVEEAIFVRGQTVVGRPGRVESTEGLGTSCDRWPGPHWMLQSDKITVRPDDRVTFHRPGLYLFGNLLFRYPWDLMLSLRRRDNRFIPEVGQNSVEGYYAKFAYGYQFGDEHSGILRLHLTQNRGVGFGFDHTLDAGKQYAEVSVFTEPSQGSLTGRLLHRGQYSDPLTSNLSLSFQENSGYGFSSTSLSGDLNLRYDTKQAHTTLGIQHSELTSGVSTSLRSSSTLDHRQTIGSSGEWEIRTNYQNSSFASNTAADQELETQFTWRQDFRAFNANLNANRRFDLDGGRYTGDDRYFSMSRLPDLVLTTDSGRLGDLRLLGARFNTTVYAGYFDQQPDDLQSYRTGVDFSLPAINVELGRDSSLRTSLRFRQMFYTDAAQWVADAQTEYRLNLPGWWETRLRFNYSHPEGFAPVRTDYASPVAAAYLDMVRLVADRMRVNVSFGKDFENGYFNDAILRGEFLLTPRNRVELQTGYSVQNSQWRPVNLRWIFATQRTWWSALTVNYNLDRKELTNVNLDVDWTPSDQWRVQFLGGYTGYGGLDQADISVTRDLHCMQAQLAYSKMTNEIRFGLGIKAFPNATRTFGVTGRGQYFESNFGDTY